MRKKLLFLFAALLCSLSMFADGALSGKFTINQYGDQISFSQGNLQYRQSDNTYRFALSQHTIQGAQNKTALAMIDADGNTSVYIDLFGWGTGTAPYFHSTNDTSYPVFHEWGNEPITNGNSAIPWRTLTDKEWRWLFKMRTNAEELFAFGKVNGVNGLILLPDEWETPSGLDFKPSTSRGLEYGSGCYINTYENNFTHNTYSVSDWDLMEQAGAVFLPAATSRQGTDVDSPGQDGWYWSSSSPTYETAYCITFDKSYFYYNKSGNRSKGMSVRLVQDVPKLEIYSEFVESTGTLTYYYDTKRLERTGVTELYDRVRTYFPDYATKVKKGVIDPSMRNAPLTNTSSLFYYDGVKPYKLSAMTSIQGLENLNTAIVTDMREMFYGCSALTSLDLSSFNTSNVTDMAAMFSGCSNLASLDLSSFNTAKVTNMHSMFAGCSALTSLDVSSFDISKVTHMEYMFYNCISLKTIYCNDDWSSSSATSTDMFKYCDNLVGGNRTKYYDPISDKTYARLDGGTEAPGYFTQIEAKPKMKLYTEFDESTGTLTYYYDDKRSERTGVTELYDPENTPDAVRFTGYYANVLKAVIDPSMKNAPLTSFRNMFYGNMDTSFKFHELNNMTSVEGMENLNTADVTNMRNMFGGCYSLATIDLSSFNTSKVTDMQGMFTSCRSLTSIDVSTFDISNVTEMRTMFMDCPALKTIYCSNDWSTSTAQSGYMFSGCTSLIGGKGTAFDKNVMDNTYARPDGGTSAPGYFTEKPAYMVGDANGNGEVEIGDVTSVLTLMATPEANGYNNQAADANGNGEIEIGDVTTILTIMAGGARLTHLTY